MRTQGSWRGKIGPTYYRHGNDPPAFNIPLARRSSVFSPSLLILAWVITWISTVPLFHIHIPDPTDRWSVLQTGGIHTVLTPDLPGEFSVPSHDGRRESSAQIGTRTINSPELGFTLIGEQVKAVDTLALLCSLTSFHAPSLFNQ